MSLPPTIYSRFYSEDASNIIPETTFVDSAVDGTFEVGYQTSSKMVRHLNADQFSFESAVDNGIQQAFQSLLQYKKPDDTEYTGKSPSNIRFAVQLTTNETVPTESEWMKLQSAIKTMSELYREFNTAIDYTVRSRLNSVIVVSKPISVDDSQPQDTLHNSFEAYINPVESGLLSTESDYESQVGDLEFTRKKKVLTIPQLYITVLDETVSKLEQIQTLDRRDREQIFSDYSGIGSKKAQKLSDIVDRLPENPFERSQNNTLRKFATAYATEYLQNNWPVEDDSITLNTLSPFTLLPINETLSSDGIKVKYYSSDFSQIPYWDEELESEIVKQYVDENNITTDDNRSFGNSYINTLVALQQ